MRFGLTQPQSALPQLPPPQNQSGGAAPTPKVKIVFLAANPKGTEPLRLREEYRAIEQALRSGDFRDRFAFVECRATRPGDLLSSLLRHRPNIVHFSGHGTAAGAIVLEDDTMRSYILSARALAKMVGGVRLDRSVHRDAVQRADRHEDGRPRETQLTVS